MIYVILLIISFIIVVFINDILIIANAHFYIYAFMIIYNIYQTKRITLFQSWLGAFLFIINAEMLQDYDILIDMWGPLFLITANNVVVIGYLLGYYRFKMPAINKSCYSHSKHSKFIFTILFLLIVYIYVFGPTAIAAYLGGRVQDANATNNESQYAISSVLSSIGLILPAIIAYFFRVYYKKKIYISLILSAPIFIILFLSGTRFPLLFSCAGFMICGNFISIQNLTFKRICVVLSLVILVVSSASIMKINRVKGVGNSNDMTEVIFIHDMFLSEKISHYMSPEGVVNMTNVSHRYFEHNNHLYGASTAFLLYFWIPRIIWQNKPQMIGYWLPRRATSINYSNVHSASFGFAGELYVDFGLFSLFFLFFLGMAIRYLDSYVQIILQTSLYNRVFAAMLFPYIFFFVRSPVTSTISFLGIVAIYYLFKKMA